MLQAVATGSRQILRTRLDGNWVLKQRRVGRGTSAGLPTENERGVHLWVHRGLSQTDVGSLQIQHKGTAV